MCSTLSTSRRCALVIAIISPALLGANFKCVAVSNPSVTSARITELQPSTPRVGDVVQARGTGSGTPPLQYGWDFGDGSSMTPGSQAAHIYDSPGTYRVTLTVHDAFGAISRDAAQVTVAARLPLPSPHAILMSDAVAAQPILFQAFSLADDTNALNYVWLFSDGQSYFGSRPTVIFPKPGTYLVSLAIVDDVDLVATHPMSIEVMDAASTSPVDSMVVIGFTRTEF